MPAALTIENAEYDEFDDTELEATEKVAAAEAEDSANDAEAESEAKGESEAKPEADAPADEEDRSNLIARHRYNFQRDQRIAAERQLQEVTQRMAQYEAYIRQQQQQQLPEERVDYDAQLQELDQKLEEARADGDTSQVAKLRGQQRQIERQVVLEQMQLRMPQQEQIDPRELARQAAESTRLESVVTQLEKQYPMLDETHATFDAEVSEEIMNLYETLGNKMPASQAMERAVFYVTKAYGINPALDVPAARKNVERNIRAAAAQPPEMDGVGMDSAKAGITRSVDVAKMTQDQFEALDDKEIEKLLASA